MTLREWIVKALGGDEPVVVSGVADVGIVELWRSELVASAIRDAGIPCEVAPTGGPPGRSEFVSPMARIYVRADDLADARLVFDSVTR